MLIMAIERLSNLSLIESYIPHGDIRLVILGSGGDPESTKGDNIRAVLKNYLPKTPIIIPEGNNVRSEEDLKPAGLSLIDNKLQHYPASMATLKALQALETSINSLPIGQSVLTIGSDAVTLVRNNGLWHLLEKPQSREDLKNMLSLQPGSDDYKTISGVAILQVTKTTSGLLINNAIAGADIASTSFGMVSQDIRNLLITSFMDNPENAVAGGIPYTEAVYFMGDTGFSYLGLGRPINGGGEPYLGSTRTPLYPKHIRPFRRSSNSLRDNIDPYKNMIFMRGKAFRVWLKQILDNNNPSEVMKEIRWNTMNLIFRSIYEKNLFPNIQKTLKLQTT